MKAVAALVLLLVVRLSLSCNEEGTILICRNIPSAFSPGLSSVVMILSGVGEINSTVFRSDDLDSVTRLRIENADVTGIAYGAFGSLSRLAYLGLNQNLLTEINPKWFARPGVLGELNLAENRIEVLHESALKGFLNLTRLGLSKNRIRTIDPNSFSSLAVLAELDLSENCMTRVSPQVFRSLGSTRIRLDGNPWDCSCGAEDFVDFLKDLQSRSLLNRPAKVTCESPPSLKGRPVWNVTVCMTSPRPPSVTAHPKPTDVLTGVPTSTSGTSGTSATVVTSRPTSETRASVQPKATDAPVTMSSNTATPPARPTPETKPSATLSTVTASTLYSAAHVTSPPSVTETSVRPNPSDPPTTVPPPTGTTGTCATSRPSSDANVVCALAVAIAVLSSLLFAVCFLLVLRRRKRSSKTVTPGRPEEGGPEEDGPESPGRSEETGWRTAFTGVRAKSANAILFTSPFRGPVKDGVTLQTETDAESRAGGKRKLGDETEVDGGVETADDDDDDDDVIKKAKQAEAGGDLDENSHRVPVNANTVPYLSIGTNQNKPGPDDVNKRSTDASGQRSRTGKVMGRISTWPPTAVQWQARCEAKEEDEEGPDSFSVWTPKSPGEVETVLKPEEPRSGCDWDQKEDDPEDSLMEDLRTAPNQDPLKMTAAPVTPKPSDQTTCFGEALTSADARLEEQLEAEDTIPDPVTGSRTQTLTEEQLCPKQEDLKSAASPARRKTRAVTSRRRAESGSTGPLAPSGGASPDDATLLSGNEYAFMDLLHEVVQNNGRWTRDRWKQKEANKQRRHDRGGEGV